MNWSPDFWQYRLGLLMDLDERGIQYYENEDGTIIADLPGCGWMQMTREMQEQNYRRRVNKICGREVYPNV
jgi:hypothetical protein